MYTATLAKGVGVLRAANAGKHPEAVGAEATPLRDPDLNQCGLDLRDIAEAWRRGSVVAFWLPDLAGTGLAEDPVLSGVKRTCFGFG